MKSIKRIVALTLLLLSLASVMLVATGCSSKVGEVDSATIRYDGDTISWDAAKNAVKYNVKINGTDIGSTTGTTIAQRSEASSVNIEITPIGKKDKEGKTASRTFTKLDTIENLYFDENGKLSWDAVAGASAYIVEVNGKQSERITATSYSTFEVGKVNNIRVRPDSTDNTTYSRWSDTVSKTYLAPPSNVKFDGSKITWSGYAQASGYDIYVNGSKVNNDLVTTSYYMYEANGMSFNLTMKSVGDGTDVFSSGESEIKKYVYLQQASNFIVSDGDLKWDPVDGAVSYTVMINGSEKTVTKPEFTDIQAGRDNVIKVKPMGDPKAKDVTYFSDWSLEQNVHILATPVTSWNGNMNLDGEAMNAFQWEFTEGKIASYEVVITLPDGTTYPESVSKDRDNFGYAFIESGTYKIQIKAVAESGTGVYDSAPSEPITVIRLAPPAPDNNFIESNPEDVSWGFKATFINDAKASGYAIYKEGNLITNTTGNNAPNSVRVTDIINSNVTSRQEITYSAQAIGSGKMTVAGGERLVTLSSLSSKNYSFKITVLASPELNPIQGTTLTWSNSQGANGYKVSGIGSGAVKPTETFDFNELNITAGDYEVKVCARGNGADILASPPSAHVRVRKLAAPTDVHVLTTGESEGSLAFEGVQGATGYNVYFNGNETPINSNNVNNVNDYVTQTGVSIRVAAVADSFDDATQIYCLSSEKSSPVTLTKLATPYFAETPHNNTSIIWVGPTNISASTPGYHVYTGSGLAYSGVYNSTEFSLDSFEAGTYTFFVQAVGDGRTTINSNRSEPLTVTKLATPQVAINAAEGVYYWRGVSDAQRYVVRINGQIVKTVDTAGAGAYFSYAPSNEFKAVATYAVTVTAVSDSDIDSKPFRIDQIVKQLSAPEFTVKYSAQSYAPGEKIQVTATATDENANGFVFTVGGASSEAQSANTYEHLVNATGVYGVSVTSVGMVFDEEYVYYINSPAATTKNITILGSVASNKIKLTTEGKLSWTAVDGAVMGYEIVVDYGDGTTETFTASASNPSVQFDLYDATYNPTAKFNINNAANYTFKIRAIGNSSGTLIASAWVEWDMSKQGI